MTIIIGISGKIGSGKNYLADQLIEHYAAELKTAAFASFAKPLKDDVNAILAAYYPYAVEGDIFGAIADISATFDMPAGQTQELLSKLRNDLLAKPNLNAHVDRSEGVRQALQFYGTEIRRAADDQYWIKRFQQSLDLAKDYILVTDTRFWNEADFLVANGILIRIEISSVRAGEHSRWNCLFRGSFKSLIRNRIGYLSEF
jgi:hypothetical protein